VNLELIGKFFSDFHSFNFIHLSNIHFVNLAKALEFLWKLNLFDLFNLFQRLYMILKELHDVVNVFVVIIEFSASLADFTKMLNLRALIDS
jgi:hypothetical protein